MSMDKMIPLMLGGIKDTLYMTTVSTLFAYLLGLPIAILLVLTAPSGLKPQKLVYRLLDMIVNPSPARLWARLTARQRRSFPLSLRPRRMSPV